jgi:hypothetical protein
MNINIREEEQRTQNYYLSFPLVDNLSLDEDKEIREQLILCPCFAHYRVLVNGNIPISDLVMDGIKCPLCGTDAKNYRAVSGHSGDWFNATVRKL